MDPKKTILMIDNDRSFTFLIGKFLTEICGYEVKIVPDGYNGIIAAKKLRPGLILLDIRMPAMNGLDILMKLKSCNETASTPVIILTGFDDDKIKSEALALKAAEYLIKPVNLEILREKIAAALDA